MNTRQKLALWIGIAVIGALCFFPPQVVLPDQPSLAVLLQGQIIGSGSVLPNLPYTRYAFLFSPPHGSVGIDWQRFLLPLCFVVAATLGAVLTLQTKRPAPEQVPLIR